jgi:prepilin-type processing-associated H-X9-DG protein
MTQTPTTDKPRLSGQALAGLLFGLAPVTGPLALYFGYRGLYAVNASNGRLLGRRLAIVGMALGAVGTALLVVGSVALLLVKMRSTSDRFECMNNLRVIGMAVTQYEENNGVFPQAVMPLYGEPLERHASWLAGVLPYLDAGAGGQKWQTLAGQLDLTKPWDDSANSAALTTYVPYFQCRGDPAFDPRGRPGVTNYVGVAGVGENAAELPQGHPCAGFFGYDYTPGPAYLIAQTLGAQGLAPAGAPMGSLVQVVAAAKVAESLNRTLTLADLKRLIYTSDKSKATSTGYKMMVVETTDHVGPWIAGGPPTARGVGFDPTFLTEQGASVVGVLSQPGGDYFAAGALLVPRPPEPSLIGPGRPFGGLHAGGMNVLWVDGSVRFVPDTMSPRTFRMQATLCNDPDELAALP